MDFAHRMALQSRSDFDWAQFDLASQGQRHWLGLFLHICRDAVHACHWRSARLGFLALTCAFTAWLFTTAWTLSNKAESAERAVRAATTTAFPSIQLVIDAPTQAGRELSALRSASGQPGPADMETLLATLGSTHPKPPASFSYEAGILSFPCDGPWTDTQRFKLESKGYGLSIKNGSCQLAQRSSTQGANP